MGASMCIAICISQNFYICDLSSDQTQDLCITSLWENIETRPASNKRVKTTQFFQDCDKFLGAIY